MKKKKNEFSSEKDHVSTLYNAQKLFLFKMLRETIVFNEVDIHLVSLFITISKCNPC